MTKRLDDAIAAVRRLPIERQDELAELLEAAAGSGAHTPDQLAAIDEGLADAHAGRFAEDAEIDRIFEKYRRG